LAAQRDLLPKLDSDLSPRLRAPACVQHDAQHAVDAEPGVPEAGVLHFEITAARAKRILAVRRALAAPAQDSSQRHARWCTSGRASSNRTSMAGLPSWRMVNLAPSPAMYTGECWGAWARASFIAPAIVRSVPSD